MVAYEGPLEILHHDLEKIKFTFQEYVFVCIFYAKKS